MFALPPKQSIPADGSTSFPMPVQRHMNRGKGVKERRGAAGVSEGQGCEAIEILTIRWRKLLMRGSGGPLPPIPPTR